ncbi:unnamed protein product [Miscanthus lutarioriparius]|uniref:Uncharacterized protein n=1 Tax=Miscanthus lutarioriparius TaxID=422564 RepID=A0A811MKT0_9POAL|nr:unnamed protein product [Miscanthus lutarioriparius]
MRRRQWRGRGRRRRQQECRCTCPVRLPEASSSSSLPAGTLAFAKSPTQDAESETAFSMSPTSVLDAAAAFAPGTDGVGASKRRRPVEARDNNGLADALDCSDQQQERIVLAATSSSSSLVRSCSLDRRVEFGVKNKSSWLPLRACSGREATSPAPADPREIIEPSSEDYTCVISAGPNLRTVHIFGDRVVEGGAGAAAERGGELAAADQSAGARRPGLLQPLNDPSIRA